MLWHTGKTRLWARFLLASQNPLKNLPGDK
jgi:hypothetical protein